MPHIYIYFYTFNEIKIEYNIFLHELNNGYDDNDNNITSSFIHSFTKWWKWNGKVQKHKNILIKISSCYYELKYNLVKIVS